MARDEVWDALKDHAKQTHDERVAKNPDRILRWNRKDSGVFTGSGYSEPDYNVGGVITNELSWL